VRPDNRSSIRSAVKVCLGGRLPPRGGPRLAARIVGLDRVTDLAVLKVDTTGLAALPFGDSDRLREGQLVLKSGDAVVLGIEREGGLLFLPFELN